MRYYLTKKRKNSKCTLQPSLQLINTSYPLAFIFWNFTLQVCNLTQTVWFNNIHDLRLIVCFTRHLWVPQYPTEYIQMLEWEGAAFSHRRWTKCSIRIWMVNLMATIWKMVCIENLTMTLVDHISRVQKKLTQGIIKNGFWTLEFVNYLEKSLKRFQWL